MVEVLSLSSITEKVVGFLPQLFWALFLVLVFYVAAHACKKIVRKILKRRLQEGARGFASDVVFVIVLVTGFMLALFVVGVNATALAAGLGISGFVIAFSLQSMISNTASGFFILLSRTFESGDMIQVAGFEGKVKTVKLKHTIMERDTKEGKEEILMPNSVIFNSALVIKKRASR